MSMTKGDLYYCVLEDSTRIPPWNDKTPEEAGSYDDFSHPLRYDAIFRSYGGALHYISTCSLPSPLVMRFLYTGISDGEDSFNMKRMAMKDIVLYQKSYK